MFASRNHVYFSLEILHFFDFAVTSWYKFYCEGCDSVFEKCYRQYMRDCPTCEARLLFQCVKCNNLHRSFSSARRHAKYACCTDAVKSLFEINAENGIKMGPDESKEDCDELKYPLHVDLPNLCEGECLNSSKNNSYYGNINTSDLSFFRLYSIGHSIILNQFPDVARLTFHL